MNHLPAHHAPRAAAAALALIFVAAGTLPARAQAPPSDLSLEDLMQVSVEPVFGASLRVQPLTEAPASVTIVTADDIARHGYETISEILADVRGFHITNDRNYTFLGARGFALPGDFNTRVLLLVDGHRINDAIYEQATLGHELVLDAATFDRVEIIRGPASALYGTSAFFAVVNIITRTGKAIDGVTTTLQGGTFGDRVARVAAGRAFDTGIDVAIVGTVGTSDGPDRLYFPEFDSPETNDGIAQGLDGEDYRRVFGRVTFGDLRVTGVAGSRDKDVPTASYDTVFGDPRLTTTDARAYLDATYERLVDTTRVTIQASIDRLRYEGIYPYWTGEPGASDVTLLNDFAEGRWWTLGGRVSRTIASRHTLTAGADLRTSFHEQQGGGYDGDPDSAFLVSNTSRTSAVYAQDEFAVNRHLLLTGGVRYDRYAGFDRVTPRASAIVKTSDDQAFKYLFGNAFRAPNTFELDYYSHPVRRLDLRPETINSHELVWERYTGRWLRTSTSVYLNSIADLISFFDDGAGNFFFENIGRVRSRGLELEAEARHRSGVRAQVSYVLQDAVDRDTDTPLVNSPRHAVKVQASASGPYRSTAALSLQYLSNRRALDGGSSGDMTLANVSIRVPVGSGLVLTGLVRNLFDDDYAHPGSAEHLQRAIPQNGRSLLVGIEWRVDGR